MVTDRSEASKLVMRRMPLRASCWALRNSSAPTPMGVTGPRPVTTTLLIPPYDTDGAAFRTYPGIRGRAKRLLLLADELDGVADGADALGFLVGDLHAELVLEAHDQLDHVERVGSEVLHEARLVGDVARVGVELVGYNFFDLLEYLVLVHELPPRQHASGIPMLC